MNNEELVKLSVATDKLTASIRRASDRLAKLGTDRYRAQAEGDAPRLAKVDGQIARTKAR